MHRFTYVMLLCAFVSVLMTTLELYHNALQNSLPTPRNILEYKTSSEFQHSSTMTTKTYDNINPEYKNKLKFFHRSISDEETRLFRSLIGIFHQTIAANATYFMYGGTLLGSYRHHGMIPWDDDIDVIVDNRHRSILQKLLEGLGPKYELNIRNYASWKFYFINSTETKEGWNWPFIDIFFFDSNNATIWDIHQGFSKIKYAKSDVFPLITRPLMDIQFPAPRNTAATLRYLYRDLDVCASPRYDHKNEYWIQSANTATIPCEVLKEMFHFVKRIRLLDATFELLLENNNVSVYDPQRERFV